MPRSNIFRKCRYCTEKFEVSRQWQLFCSNNCRKKWNYLEAGFCFYCGEPGNISRDHIHPVCARSEAKRSFKGQETVYACNECNSTLGGKVFDAIEFRVESLIKVYTKKYKLDKGAVLWDDEEIGELGRDLRIKIKHLLLTRQKAERRVLYLQVVLLELLKDREKQQSYEEGNTDSLEVMEL